MKFIFLSSSLAVLTSALFTQSELPGPVKAHVNLLQDAKSLKADFTVQKLGGGLEKGTLLYSKTGLFKIDTQTTLTESDGKMVWTFNKQANTYTEIPASLAPTKDSMVWAWAAFFNVDALKGTKDYVPKGARTLRGSSVSEFSVKMANDKAFTLYLDAKTGVARGLSNADAIILATGDIVLGKVALDAKDFAFMPPSGATKIEKPAADSITYAMVETILKANCLPCHSATSMKSGLSVDSYEGVMRKVTAGNAMASALFRSISGPRATMPQGKAPLSKADLDTIEVWINAGAKNP